MTAVEAALLRGDDRDFLVSAASGDALSYRQTARVGRDIATLFLEHGVKPHDRALLIASNSVELAILYMACGVAGVTAIPVSPERPARDVIEILQATKARLVLAPGPLGFPLPPGVSQWRFKDRTSDWPSLSWLRPGPPAHQNDAHSIPCEDLLSIIFTSGTTGRPKGVAHTAAAMLGNARSFNEHMGIDQNSAYLHLFPMTYMAGYLNSLIGPMVAGGRVVIGDMFGPRTALNFWDHVIEHRVNSLWLAPTMLAALLKLDRDHRGPEYARQHLRTVSVGTAPLPQQVRTAARERYGIRLFESYGLSETLLVSSQRHSEDDTHGSVGALLPGVQSVGHPPDGAEVDLAIRSEYSMAGYVLLENGDVQVASAPEVFPTGDIGRFDEAGRLYITGRRKDLIIRGGINISPLAVEEVLLDGPELKEAAVVGIPHEFYGEEVLAAVVLCPGQDLGGVQKALEQRCRERLPVHEVPTAWISQESLPRGISGKVQKVELKRRLARNPDRQE